MKKLLYIFLLILIPILLTGCKQDDMDGITITTTSYPIEYVTKRLYGRHAKVKSVYPDGVDQNTYQISAKTKKKISETNLFIYNGNLENDKKLALELLDLNPSLKIIDASLVITPTYSSYELWLNPSYLLMMSQNIRTGLKEYITSSLLEKEIDKNHELLKEELSKLDANIRLAIDNSRNKSILTSNKELTYLRNFGFNVYVLNKDTKEKEKVEIENVINREDLSYIYAFKNDNINDVANNFINKFNLKIAYLHKLDNISDLERSENKDYISITNENLDLLKQELYQ